MIVSITLAFSRLAIAAAPASAVPFTPSAAVLVNCLMPEIILMVEVAIVPATSTTSPKTPPNVSPTSCRSSFTRPSTSESFSHAS